MTANIPSSRARKLVTREVNCRRLPAG
jgi:hypothetical protein